MDVTLSLYNAARKGNLPRARWLLTEGGARVTEADANGKTALLCAAQNGHLDMVRWLLTEGGARVSETDRHGSTALMYATHKGHLKVVQWLLEKGGARVTDVDCVGMTALLCAARMGHLDVVQWLVTEGGAHVGECDNSGSTALHFATGNGHGDIVHWLLAVAGACVDEATIDANTPPLIVAVLLHYGAPVPTVPCGPFYRRDGTLLSSLERRPTSPAAHWKAYDLLYTADRFWSIDAAAMHASSAPKILRTVVLAARRTRKDLPPEMWLHVFGFLRGRDLLALEAIAAENL